MSNEQIIWVNKHLDAARDWFEALPEMGQLAIAGAFFLIASLLPIALGW